MGVAARRAYLDNLKVIIVAGVIFGHAWAGYDHLGGWAYTDAREVSVSPVTEVVFEILLGPFGLFAMGVFFLIAGLLTDRSLQRKGFLRFSRDRLARLGIPLALFTFVFWPPVSFYLDRLAGHREVSLGDAFVSAVTDPDPSYLWFVEVLLLYTLAYALWRTRFGTTVRPGQRLDLAHLLGLGAAIAVLSYVIRVWFPLGSSQYGELHLSQWPQYLVLFGLGVMAGRRGWLDPVPAGLRRGCGVAAMLAAVAIGAFAIIVAAAHVPADDFLGGGHWPSIGVAAAEGVLAVTVSVWLLGFAQQHLNHAWGEGHAARSAYAAYVLQGFVLVGLALLLRPVPFAAEAKAAVVSVLGVVLTFQLAWILVTRTVLRRIL